MDRSTLGEVVIPLLLCRLLSPFQVTTKPRGQALAMASKCRSAALAVLGACVRPSVYWLSASASAKKENKLKPCSLRSASATLVGPTLGENKRRLDARVGTQSDENFIFTRK